MLNGSAKREGRIMRIATLAITALLAVGLAFPAAAAKKRTVSEATLISYEACAKKAHDQGLVPGQAGRIEFMKECMGARPGASPSSERR
jgi:hypothetical protein